MRSQYRAMLGLVRPDWRKYVICVLAIALALALTAIIPFGRPTPYLLLLTSVVICAWYGGLVMGLAATVVEAVSADLFFVQPPGFGIAAADSAIRFVLFVSVAALVSFWASSKNRARSELEEMGARFRLIMDNVQNYAIVLADSDGLIVDFNKGARTILALDESDLGRSLDLIFIDEDRATGAFKGEIRQAAVTGQANHERYHLRKDFSRFWASGLMVALRRSDGTLAGYVKIVRDLTDKKRQEDQRSRLVAELEKANRAKENMMAILAHDLRAPLTSILGWSSLRRAGKISDSATVDRAFDSIARNATRQLQLIEKLLSYSEITLQSGFRFHPCDLKTILRDAVETVRPLAELKDIEIAEDYEKSIMTLSGDTNWLHQAFVNILSNGIKYTPCRGRIEIGVRSLADSLEVKVSDTGVGIERELLPQIWEPFRRGGAESGAGLGLAIVRDVIGFHHGEVRAESEGAGKGTTFTITVPRTIESAA